MSRRAAFPLPVPVALAAGVNELPGANARALACQPKLDGWRLLAGERLWTRHGTDVTDAFAEVADAVHALPSGCVLDGELVALNEQGCSNFDGLARRYHAARRGTSAAATPVRLVVFDLLAAGGEDLRRRPHQQRRQQLETLLIDVDDARLVLCAETEDQQQAISWCRDLAPLGVEGLVLKPPDARYPLRPNVPCWREWKLHATWLVERRPVSDSIRPPSSSGKANPTGCTSACTTAATRPAGATGGYSPDRSDLRSRIRLCDEPVIVQCHARVPLPCPPAVPLANFAGGCQAARRLC